MEIDVYDVVANEDQRVRKHNIVKEGDVIPQGDIYLTRISDDVLEGRQTMQKTLNKQWSDFRFGKMGKETQNRQLVPDNTMGSRHIVEGEVTIYAPGHDRHALEGPVIVAGERFMLTHPEHASHSIPEGTYQVTYQRDYTSEEARRVMD